MDTITYEDYLAAIECGFEDTLLQEFNSPILEDGEYVIRCDEGGWRLYGATPSGPTHYLIGCEYNRHIEDLCAYITAARTTLSKMVPAGDASPTHGQLREIGRQVTGLLKACGLDKKETAAESIEVAAKMVTSLRKQVHALTVYSDHKKKELQAIANSLGCSRSDILEKVSASMGVGGGNGSLFVHGSIEAITAAQALVLRAEDASAADKIRQLTEEVADLDGEIKALSARDEHACHFIRSMGFTPSNDIEADLSACLAKYAKTSSDLDAAMKNYSNALADWSAAKAEAATSEEAMRHTVKALAALTGATLDDEVVS